MPVVDELALKPDLTDTAWELYAQIFDDVNRRAVQKHLLSEAEFRAVCTNEDLIKFLAYDGDQLVGMSVLTNNLDAWPLVSPEYFEQARPEDYRRKAIWYCGFVGARKNRSHAFRELVLSMSEVITSNDGVVVMDYCDYNVNVRHIPEVAQAVVSHSYPRASTQRLDAQSFYMIDFGGGRR